MPRTRPLEQIRAVFDLKSQGLTDREVSCLTAVPVDTIRLWRKRRATPRIDRVLNPSEWCTVCDGPRHDPDSLPRSTYAYVLGVYLGDGQLTRWGGSWVLRVTLDEQYPGIIADCSTAIAELRGEAATRRPDTRAKRCIYVESAWQSWPCLFPQHGSGRKHLRRIELVDWQRPIVDAEPKAFLRGLVHTDGWRGLNRVRVKGQDYAYPRYQFSNRSDDIRKLFTDA